MVLRTVASPAPLPLPSPPLCAPKQGILGSRRQENSSPCPKTGHFGVPNPEKRPPVPQNLPFWDPKPGKSRLRWAKQAFLPIHGRENSTPLGKTGTFAHPRPGKKAKAGQGARVARGEWQGGQQGKVTR